MTINKIIKEVKEVPDNRLEELYQLVHSMRSTKKPNASTKKKILSFAGTFKDLPADVFKENDRVKKITN